MQHHTEIISKYLLLASVRPKYTLRLSSEVISISN